MPWLLLLIAGLLLLVDPGGTDTAQQVLALVSLAAIVAGLLPVPRTVSSEHA